MSKHQIISIAIIIIVVIGILGIMFNFFNKQKSDVAYTGLSPTQGVASDSVFEEKRYQNLADSIAKGDIEAVEKAHDDKSINWKIVGTKGLTLGHFALYAQTPEMLDLVLGYGADPVAMLENGYTIPHYTLNKKDASGQLTDSWLAVTLKHGASPDLIGKQDMDSTLVNTAVIFKNTKAIDLLAKSGANLNLTSPGNSRTPIHNALTLSNLALAAHLADLGCDPRIKDTGSKIERNAAEKYCKFLSGRLDASRKPDFDLMKTAFAKYNLEIPCDF